MILSASASPSDKGTTICCDVSSKQSYKALSSQLQSDGYALTNDPILSPQICAAIRERMPKLFRGEFETGIYPDEWHWREGISKPNAAREMCNAWKSDRTIASVVLNQDLGKFVASVMGWSSVRVAQDDLVWKPPSDNHEQKRIDTVGFHQDSAYISAQFVPYDNNSVTVWMALDPADEETGCLEYAVGSHLWRPFLDNAPNKANPDILLNQSPDADKKQGTSQNNKDEGISSFHSSNETSYRDGIFHAAKKAGKTDSFVIQTAPAVEGQAIFHHQDTWHGSGPNRSLTRHRRALVAHYIRGDVKFRPNEPHCQGVQPPWGSSSYIYGRYKHFGNNELDESFFPIIYADDCAKTGQKRTTWLDDYIASHVV